MQKKLASHFETRYQLEKIDVPVENLTIRFRAQDQVSKAKGFLFIQVVWINFQYPAREVSRAVFGEKMSLYADDGKGAQKLSLPKILADAEVDTVGSFKVLAQF